MNKQLSERYVADLDAVIADYRSYRQSGGSAPSGDAASRVLARALAAIERIGGRTSAYARQASDYFAGPGVPGYKLEHVIGVCQALRADVAAGWLESLVELAHADVFSDVLEMADHLAEAGYKDAAAVLSGASLESHLRQLCSKHGIDALTDGRPKKADLLNADLRKAGVYEQLDQKSVTSWLDLRNKAAHGEYDKYEASQVRALISGVRDFLRRHPA